MESNSGQKGTLVALDYSDPGIDADTWWVPTANVPKARKEIREHVGEIAERNPSSISTTVVKENCLQPDGVPQPGKEEWMR